MSLYCACRLPLRLCAFPACQCPREANPLSPQAKPGLAERPAKLGPQEPSLSQGESGIASPEGKNPSPQSRRASLLETISSTFIGFWLAVLANMLILPLFPQPGDFLPALAIGLIFTLISLVRGYLLRRAFNLLHKKGILQ